MHGKQINIRVKSLKFNVMKKFTRRILMRGRSMSVRRGLENYMHHLFFPRRDGKCSLSFIDALIKGEKSENVLGNLFLYRNFQPSTSSIKKSIAKGKR